MVGRGLDDLANIKDSARWPRTLSILHELLSSYFNKRRGMTVEAAAKEASECVSILATYFGGRPLYIPTGARLKNELRQREIYQQHNGRNTQELAEKYGVTDRCIHKIVKREMELARARAREAQK